MFFDLSSVERITSDAIAVLLAVMARSMRERQVSFGGNQPMSEKAQRVLAASGFYDLVQTKQTVATDPLGRIKRRDSKKVEAATASELIRFGGRCLHEKEMVCQAAYSAMLECMGNSNNHASGIEHVEETWWATVYVDPDRRRACFTFVDMGVGIFKSLKIKTNRKVLRLFGLDRDDRILQDLFAGVIGSRTQLPFRGKGLPRIRKLADSRRLQEVKVLTNDVFGDVSGGVYRLINGHFHGTLIYWEVDDASYTHAAS